MTKYFVGVWDQDEKTFIFGDEVYYYGDSAEYAAGEVRRITGLSTTVVHQPNITINLLRTRPYEPSDNTEGFRVGAAPGPRVATRGTELGVQEMWELSEELYGLRQTK